MNRNEKEKLFASAILNIFFKIIKIRKKMLKCLPEFSAVVLHRFLLPATSCYVTQKAAHATADLEKLKDID